MLIEELSRIQKILIENKIDHALIGGLALGAHGVQRFTNDIDLLISEEDVDRFLSLFEKEGFNVFHSSSDVLQFEGRVPIDVIIARRPVSLKLLKTAKVLRPFKIKCVSVEGLIGLKIQAYKNNFKREFQDKADIQALISSNKIDWKKVKKFADLFDEWEEMKRIKRLCE